MAYEPLDLLINGQFRHGSEGKSEPVTNPATEEVLGQLPHASAADLDEALAASEAGFAVWKNMTALARQAIMERAARLMEERTDAIAETLSLEMGKPVGEAKMEMGFTIDVLRWYGEEGKRAYGRLVPLARCLACARWWSAEPVGPVAAFVAWNFPGVNVMRKVAGRTWCRGARSLSRRARKLPARRLRSRGRSRKPDCRTACLNLVFGVPR